MSRILRRGAVVVTVILMWAAGSLLMYWDRADSVDGQTPGSSRGSDAPTPRATPTRSGTPPPAKVSDLGFQLSAHHSGRVRYADRVMRRLAAGGAQWVRVDVGWATLQSTGPGAFDQWYAEEIDHVLASARRHGLKVIVLFWLTPAWASPNGSLYAPPADVREFAAGIERAVQRWQRLVDAWEIWNEPNLDAFFEGTDPTTYTRLLCAAYPAVKAHTDKPVLFGGLMFNDAEWLEKAYRAGAQGCFDALATHPYVGPSDAAPETPSVGAAWRLTSTPAMHALMKKWGDGDKRIWITELGWSTGVVNDGNPWQRPVDAAQQADFLGRAVRLVRSDYSYVGPIIWYRDVDDPTRRYEDGFGLLRPDLSDKPAMRAFRAAALGR